MNTSINKNKNYSLIVLLISLFLITSCGLYKRSDVSDNPINDKDKREKNINEGKGITLGSLRNSGGGNFQFASSNPMWRATLEVLDFVPLANADYGGGIISTDWYYDDNSSNESLKITVQFLSNEIRVDGIKVSLFKKNCTTNNNCSVNKIDSDLNRELKMAILKKAAKIKNGDLKKTRKGKGKYKEAKTE